MAKIFFRDGLNPESVLWKSGLWGWLSILLFVILGCFAVIHLFGNPRRKLIVCYGLSSVLVPLLALTSTLLQAIKLLILYSNPFYGMTAQQTPVGRVIAEALFPTLAGLILFMVLIVLGLMLIIKYKPSSS
jgi:hypothetical protein